MSDYLIYRVTQSPYGDAYTQINKVNLLIRDGVYIFYTSSHHRPEAVYPIMHFYLVMA